MTTATKTPEAMAALRCLEELANMPLGISLEEWGRVSSPILAALQADAEMLAALRNVQKIISEGAMTGFRWEVGDWAQRLYESQQKTSGAIAAASWPSRTTSDTTATDKH